MHKLILNKQHQFDIFLTMVCQYPALVWRSFAYELRTFAYELRSFSYGLRTLHAYSAPLALSTYHAPTGKVCSAIARRFFFACSKFDGACSARGVCLVHIGDSTVHVWRTHGVKGYPQAHVAYLPRICYFFVRRASAVASPTSGTGAFFSAGSRLWVCYQPRFEYQWGCRCQDVTILMAVDYHPDKYTCSHSRLLVSLNIWHGHSVRICLII